MDISEHPVTKTEYKYLLSLFFDVIVLTLHLVVSVFMHMQYYI